MAIKDVSDLKVYTQSLNLISNMYVLLKLLPRTEVVLINQIRRAIQSIPANIAEGFAKKNSEKEFRRYLLIALLSVPSMQFKLWNINKY